MQVDVTKKSIDVLIKEKCKVTRTVKFKDHNTKVFSKYAFNLKMFDSISNPNSPYPYSPINASKDNTDNQRIFRRDSKSASIQQRQSCFAKTSFNYNYPDHVTLNLDVNKQILDVIIKAKSKLTRTVNVKDKHSKVFSKSMSKLKVSDRISNSNSPYTNDNQCNNIAYRAPSRNKIQPSICNQRKVINNPLVVDNNIRTCRLTLSNERTSFNFNMIVPSGVDLQNEKRNSHPIKNIALTQKEKDASINIRSNIMISNNNTIISITLRKKLNNDMLPNNDTNPINANSHNTITKNINTNNALNQQHVQKQIIKNNLKD